MVGNRKIFSSGSKSDLDPKVPDPFWKDTFTTKYGDPNFDPDMEKVTRYFCSIWIFGSSDDIFSTTGQL